MDDNTSLYLIVKYGSIQEAYDVWFGFKGIELEPHELEILDEYFSQFSDGMLRQFLLKEYHGRN